MQLEAFGLPGGAVEEGGHGMHSRPPTANVSAGHSAQVPLGWGLAVPGGQEHRPQASMGALVCITTDSFSHAGPATGTHSSPFSCTPHTHAPPPSEPST
eukprot:1853715-Rhodomonas_salina.1